MPRRCSEPFGELGTAVVRLVGDLDDRGAEVELGARREVGAGQVEVDEELIAGLRPTVAIVTGEQRDRPGVHDRDLALGLGRAVLGLAAAPLLPRVADETDVLVQLAGVEQLALAHGRAADDELDEPVVLR